MIATIARVLGITVNAVTQAENAVVSARGALVKGEEETREATAAVAKRGAELGAVEIDYDRDPTDSNGKRVIAARDALALAKLRQERASRREDDAHAALVKAEADAVKARAAHAVEQAREREDHAVEGQARATRELEAALCEARERVEALYAASAERSAAAQGRRALEKAYSLIDLEELRDAALFDSARAEGEPIAALVATVESIRENAVKALSMSADGQKAAAALAHELGERAEPVPARYGEALLLRARFDARPYSEKTGIARDRHVIDVHRVFDPYTVVPSGFTREELVELLLSRPRVEINRIESERNAARRAALANDEPPRTTVRDPVLRNDVSRPIGGE